MRGIRGRRQRPEKKLESRARGSGAASAVDGQSGWPGAAGAWRSQSLGSGNRREEWRGLTLSGRAAWPYPAPPHPRIPETQVPAPGGGGGHWLRSLVVGGRRVLLLQSRPPVTRGAVQPARRLLSSSRRRAERPRSPPPSQARASLRALTACLCSFHFLN